MYPTITYLLMMFKKLALQNHFNLNHSLTIEKEDLPIQFLRFSLHSIMCI